MYKRHIYFFKLIVIYIYIYIYTLTTYFQILFIYLLITINDNNKILLMNNANPTTITLPVLAASKVGTQVSFIQNNTGQLNFEAAEFANIRHPDSLTKSYKRWAMVSAIYTEANNWVLVGDLV